RLRHLSDALALYRGELLPGHGADWISAERRRLERRFADALEAALSLHEERDELSQALEFAERWAALDPFQEAARLALVRLLAKTGRPKEALLRYRSYRRRLRKELNAPPS